MAGSDSVAAGWRRCWHRIRRHRLWPTRTSRGRIGATHPGHPDDGARVARRRARRELIARRRRAARGAPPGGVRRAAGVRRRGPDRGLAFTRRGGAEPRFAPSGRSALPPRARPAAIARRRRPVAGIPYSRRWWSRGHPRPAWNPLHVGIAHDIGRSSTRCCCSGSEGSVYMGLGEVMRRSSLGGCRRASPRWHKFPSLLGKSADLRDMRRDHH